jgi:integrase/recombinase XerD
MNLTHISQENGNGNLPDDTGKNKLMALFEEYAQEMRYLRNFSERTLKSYREIFNRWLSIVGAFPDEKNLSSFIIGLRRHGYCITTCNISIRGFNSFLTWLKENDHIPRTFTNGKPFRLSTLPGEKRQLKVFSDSEIDRIISFKPRCRNDQRIYAVVSVLIDTGIRIHECLTIEVANVDFENLVFSVFGKGRKERLVPMSFELRNVLHRYTAKHRFTRFESPWLFCTASGSHLSYQNAKRDFLNLLKRVGVSKASIDHCFHSFRRKFARSYVANGGDISYLQHAMGHTTIGMTKQYIGDVEISELKTMHQRVSQLHRRKK